MSDLQRGVETQLVDDGVRSIETVRTSIIGLVGTAPQADLEKLPINVPTLFAGRITALRKAILPDGATDGGTLLDAVDMIAGITSPIIVVVNVGAVNGPIAPALIGNAAEFTGMHALLKAKAKTGVKPRLLIAPAPDGYNYTDGAITAAPLATALGSVADRLRAIAFADSPNVDASAANAAVNAIGNKRVYLTDPWVLNLAGEERPFSPVAAAMFALRDNTDGFHWTPSNTTIPNISGTSRPIDFELGDSSCEADILAGFHVNTIIREDGFRLWGVKVAQKSDSNWFQVTRVRIADIIADSIQLAHLWAIDRPITARFVDDILAGVNAYLRSLKARSIIVDGNTWADPDENTAADLNQGHLTIRYDFCDHPLAEKITMKYNLNTDYLESIVE
ncbi:MAG: phage tail sheath C-terminal domain-containing protein [Kiritimatiellales bacterium]